MSVYFNLAQSMERIDLEIAFTNKCEAYADLAQICRSKDKQLSELDGKDVSECVLFYVPREYERQVHEVLKTILPWPDGKDFAGRPIKKKA